MSVLGSIFMDLGPILTDFHAFAIILGCILTLSEKLGGKGGKAQFPKSHFSASKPLSASQPLTGTVRTCFATWIYITKRILHGSTNVSKLHLHTLHRASSNDGFCTVVRTCARLVAQ